MSRRSTGPIQFAKAFVHHVEKLVTGDCSNLQKTVKLLTPLTPFLDAEDFIYKSPAEELLGQTSLLRCLGFLVEKARVVRSPHEVDAPFLPAVYKAIANIVLRREFHSDRVDSADLDDVYFTLLDHLSSALHLCESAMLNAMPGAESFCAQVLAAVFVRFSSVAEPAVAVLSRVLAAAARSTDAKDPFVKESADVFDLSRKMGTLRRQPSAQLVLQRNSVVYCRLEMMDDFMCSFVTHLAQYVRSHAVMPESAAIASRSVFETFLVVLRAEPPTQWPAFVFPTVTALSWLRPPFLSVVVKLLLRRTSAHDLPAVDNALCRIEDWLEAFRTRPPPPATPASSFGASPPMGTAAPPPPPPSSPLGPLGVEPGAPAAQRTSLVIASRELGQQPGPELAPAPSALPAGPCPEATPGAEPAPVAAAPAQPPPAAGSPAAGPTAPDVVSPLHPAVFDYAFLFRAVRIMLQSEHFGLLLRVLRFLFVYMNDFPTEQRWFVLHRLLFARSFFKLFLHWHTGVRQAFHRLLLCKSTKTLLWDEPAIIAFLSPAQELSDTEFAASAVFAAAHPHQRDLYTLSVVRALVGFLRRAAANRALFGDALPAHVRQIAGRPPMQLYAYVQASLQEFFALLALLKERPMAEIDLPFVAPMTTNML